MTNNTNAARSAVPISLLTGALLLLCAVLLANGIFSYYKISQLVQAERLVTHTAEVRESLAELMNDMANAEAAKRAFLLTGAQTSIEQFRRAHDSAYEHLDALFRLTADDPEQQKRLGLLRREMGEKFAWTEAQIARRRATPAGYSQTPAELQRSTHLTDRVHRVVDELSAIENHLLAQRNLESRRLVYWAQATSVLFTGGVILITLLVLYLARKHAAATAASAAALRESEERYRRIFDQSPHPIWVLDPDTLRPLMVNERALEHYGYGREEFLALSMIELRPAGAVPEFLEAISHMSIAGPTRGRFQHRKKDGSIIDVEIVSQPVSYGGRTLQLVLAEDITERLRAENRLRLQAQAIEASVNGIIVINAKRKGFPIEYANPAMERITGYSAKEIAGRGCQFLRIEDGNQEGVAGVRRALTERQACNVLLKHYRKDGSPFWNELNIAPVMDDIGTVTHYVGVINDVTERVEYEEQLQKQANYDPLTDLPNRNLLTDRLSEAIAKSRRTGETVSVVMLDLDNFKYVNDSLGHAVGDQLLGVMASRIREAVEPGETVARYGGDEFVIVSSITSRQHLASCMQRVLGAISEPVLLGGTALRVNCSIGVSLCPDDAQDAATAIRHADAAMYRAKEAGKNNFQVFLPQMSERIHERVRLEQGLRAALAEERFTLHFQPQVDGPSGAIIGAEALVRWRHPLRGIVLPSEFIPVAEDSGLIVPLGRWVLTAACEQCTRWQSEGGAGVAVSVNVSSLQMRQPEFVAYVREALTQTGLPPHLLELELTESVIMSHADEVMATMQALRDMGVTLSIDDFGTGYSSLTYLKRFPVGRLKIDRSFVSGVPANGDDVAIARAVIVLARSLGLRVMAEGVETAAQADFLRMHDCDELQGYYFGRPMPGAGFIALLQERGTLTVDGEPR